MTLNETILVTGGAGFIGSNFIRYVLQNNQSVKVINLDALTYAGNPETVKELDQDFGGRHRFVHGDIRNAKNLVQLMAECTGIVHFAAESHVDRSIDGGEEFIDTNVRGTFHLLNAAKDRGIRFTHVSTDEVYGALGETGLFTENTPLAPNSPYSASKAGSDMMVRAFVHTHKLDAVITRCSNNYGPYQFPEKFIPLMVTNAMDDRPLPVYGKGLNVRDWIHVVDHCAGVWQAHLKGRTGEVYNLGGHSERRNIDVAKLILNILGKPESLLSYVEDRKGHDFRYAIDCSKAERELNWRPAYRFEKGLEETINWYRSKQNWWRPLKEKK
jgi:dTDP-glucose 4,6-dehydratase